MQVVPWPKASYGKFHTGDSYIVLHVRGNSAAFGLQCSEIIVVCGGMDGGWTRVKKHLQGWVQIQTWACVLYVDIAILGGCDSPAQTKRNPTGYEWNIHFWLGEETTKVCVQMLLRRL